ncbi:Zn-dependent protease (includes SpoIVFB) [Nocardioides alpinus]|uniref:Zinc metalloprotease n=1 Tax=Nocardioides alpinus TaxID=748909 RepID=A0A1I1BEQ6_9ACTN|nr:site-2 protease family protein [Nocardioides alpinus]PKH40510.1 site-2 protease family protein [Nocardioides alpinus]SFB47238.1 Zn-dependent protease (includes SpoIVFB) [Nocardioides alpinus]
MPDPTDPAAAEPPAPRGPRPPGTLRIGSIAGIDVLITSSWIIVAALISVGFAPRIEIEQPGLGVWKYVAGFVFAVVLYLSVLLHEASHAIVAQRLGYGVTSITLHFLGGMTEIDGASRRPRHEFWIAVVGPLTSIAVGAVALGASFLIPDGLVQVAIEALAAANLVIGVLNLVPGLPLDGGRVLKALVWGASGNQHRATLVAGWGGRLAALALLVWPLVQEPLIGVEPTLMDIVLVFILGLFLWTGATAAMAHARIRERLPALVARPLARRTLTVPEDLPLGEAVRRAQEAQAGSIVTIAPDGSPRGIVSEAAVTAMPEDRRPWVPVSAVTRAMEAGLSLPADVAGEELILAISRRPAEEYLLVEPDGQIYGVLSTADVDRAFRANAAG